jgi:DNA replication factor GINS
MTICTVSLIDIKSLYTALVREIENDSVQYMHPDTYRNIANILSNLKGQGYDGIEARVKDTLTQLVSDIAMLLIRTRLEKIKNDKIDYSNLTEEEQYIAQSEKDLHHRFDQVLSATLDGRVKALESIALKAKITHVLVRFLKPMEAIAGTDNTRYGPFEEEDVAVIPFENAKRLIEQGTAIELPWLDE